MDDLVAQGLKKWPNVPACFNWLSLDARGRWRLGPERAAITHAPTLAFIGRNYLEDGRGRWFFQNGPQRVYVELDYTPRVFRITPQGDTSGASWSLLDQIGAKAPDPTDIFIDDEGRFLIVSHGQVGVLHDHDSSLLMDRLRTSEGLPVGDETLGSALDAYLAGEDAQLWLAWPGCAEPIHVAPIARAAVAARFGFDPHPSASEGLLTAP